MHKTFSRIMILALLAGALILLVNVVSAAAVVTPGDQTSGWTQGGAMRWKNETGHDVYLGVPDLGVGANRVTAETGSVPAGSYPFTFEYDQPNNNLKATIPSKSINLTWDLDASPAPACAPADWDMLLIAVRDSKTNGGLGLSNVTLDAATLGTGTFGTPDEAGTPNWQYWTVTGLDLGNGFVFAGNLDVVGAFNANESLKIELITGCAPPPPSVDPVTESPLVCDTGSVDIVINNVTDLYGYQLEVTYDDTKVSASKTLQYGWFSTISLPPGGWGDGACSGGVCKIALSKQNPETAVSGSGVVATLDFTALALSTPTDFTVTVDKVTLTDRDGFKIAAEGGSIEVAICGVATVSGKVSLQGRPWQAGEPIGSDLAVTLSGAFGPYSATVNQATGEYSIPGVKYLLGGTDYTLDADHSLYLKNLKTPLNVNGDLSDENTRLLGGDTDNSGKVYIEDMSCIAGAFNTVPTGTSCDPGFWPDINNDVFVNIQDLSIAGGNYNEVDATPSEPRW